MSMAKTEKVTVTLPVEQVAALRELASARPGVTISGLVQRAVAASLEDAREFDAMVEEDFAASGGPITPAEQAWVDGVLGLGPPAPMPDSFAERQRVLARVRGAGAEGVA